MMIGNTKAVEVVRMNGIAESGRIRYARVIPVTSSLWEPDRAVKMPLTDQLTCVFVAMTIRKTSSKSRPLHQDRHSVGGHGGLRLGMREDDGDRTIIAVRTHLQT